MMGRVSRGPTPTASEARPSSFPLKNSSSTPLRGATSDSSNHPDYLDKRLRLARLRAPSAVIHRPGPPRGRLQRGRCCPATQGTCNCGGARISALSGGQVMMRFSPAWQADCPSVPSPVYQTVVKDI
jgi:hypothetical protein